MLKTLMWVVAIPLKKIIRDIQLAYEGVKVTNAWPWQTKKIESALNKYEEEQFEVWRKSLQDGLNKVRESEKVEPARVPEDKLN